MKLAPLTLGPDFSTQSPESFYTYVTSLKEIKNLGREVKVRLPRIKKPILKHDRDPDSLRCRHCGRRPRNMEAKCLGPAKAKADRKKVSEQENILPLEKNSEKSENA